MERFKKFFGDHKKAIIISATVVVVGVAGAIAYKLHLDKTSMIEAIADGSEVQEAIIDAADAIIKK